MHLYYRIHLKNQAHGLRFSEIGCGFVSASCAHKILQTNFM